MGSFNLQPYKIGIPQSKLDDLKARVASDPLPPVTFEGKHERYGVTRDWMSQLKTAWEAFDWSKEEARLNSFSNYQGTVEHAGHSIRLHFISEQCTANPEAMPLLLLHGWPGSFLEFTGSIKYLKQHFHVVVPSLPGYLFSELPDDMDFSPMDVAATMNELMVNLGYSQYFVQAGDWGAMVARLMAVYFSECKAIHLNFSPVLPIDSYLAPVMPSVLRLRTPQIVKTLTTPLSSLAGLILPPPDQLGLSARDRELMARSNRWNKTGRAYAIEHATRPSTIAHALSASPLALAAWIGEKLLEWTDESPPMDEILALLTAWWTTDTYARSIYAYRHSFGNQPNTKHFERQCYIRVPFGYSSFPKEILPCPKRWVATSGNLLWYREHTRGGHFAAWERPEAFSEDLRDCFAQLAKAGNISFANSKL
ncbi:uncharacterized protein L969DRAFT_19035 [Mixia osmundae IAM 14324]|uniref:Epoxide hydrolase N-terminal domain-containing protein n=1 Tax=Mixia osmundae (strain CBS 9802 / IAM 14324 / JCM 22182 / KY 12970) TaxID=764103 RepID=G7DS32_MIXOS|nr:uncharacterized protein L969DRAFT_19035 [Mixia osmundae IAM 14324]KEI37554.1 hypothetical protein L969DRAFT_19035 [Mixia osmundae IAM 14324]GAA93392.1 hypothetical protein E5Q_00032 [Mixia osmundae IAM 14324]